MVVSIFWIHNISPGLIAARHLSIVRPIVVRTRPTYGRIKNIHYNESQGRVS